MVKPRVFGGGRNAFSKYERGEVSQSVAMDKLIRVCLKHRDVFQELVREVNKA
jgi:HTH-type transcriptional regulator/antitoxin MqsA